METKKRRKTKGTVLIGRGAAKVRIYPIIRKNGYPQNTVCWKEGGRRRMRCFACLDEAKMVAHQISVSRSFPAAANSTTTTSDEGRGRKNIANPMATPRATGR